MFRLSCDIKIGNFRIKGVHQLNIESSWETLTDTAKITLPRNIFWQGKKLVFGENPLFKKGDKVTISLGYDGRNQSVFNGYLTKISNSTPVELTCEDAAWLLKQKSFTKSYAKVTMKTLLSDTVGSIVPYEIKADWNDLGQFKISNATPAQVMEELKKDYFVKSWFRRGIMYVGQAFVASLQREHKIVFNKNVIEDSLEYTKKEDVKIKIKGIIMLPNNKKEEVEVGDTDGEQRTIHKYNISKASMKTILEGEIERMKYTGYRGSITTFGEPMVEHGDIVRLYDPYYPERTGRYLVKKVVKDFGIDGYRQEIELEQKISA